MLQKICQAVRRRNFWHLLLWAVLLAVLLLRLVYLQADPPAGISTSGDLYTDEGWWATNATAQFLTGHWYLQHGYNPAVVTPVLPACEYLAFRMLGLSLTAVRLIDLLFFFLSCALCYRIMALLDNRRSAYLCVWLLGISSLLFAFSRLALLEIPMTCLLLASLYYTVLSLRSSGVPRYLLICAAALFFMLAVLTKTTAAYACPLILLSLLLIKPVVGNCAWPQRLRLLTLFFGLVALMGCGYFSLVQQRYPTDVQVFIDNNITNKNSIFENRAVTVTLDEQRDPEQLRTPKPNNMRYRLLSGLLVLGGLLLLLVPALRSSHMYIIALAWLGLYFLLIRLSLYFPSRYFVHMAFPACMLLGLTLQRMFARPHWHWRACAIAVLLVLTLSQAWRIGTYLDKPHFTFLAMARDVRGRIAALPPGAKPLLLGEQADSLSLITGIPTVNDSIWNTTLADKLSYFHPTHYIGLGRLPEWKYRLLAENYQPQFLSRYDVYGNYYTGQRLYLYRLLPK